MIIILLTNKYKEPISNQTDLNHDKHILHQNLAGSKPGLGFIIWGKDHRARMAYYSNPRQCTEEQRQDCRPLCHCEWKQGSSCELGWTRTTIGSCSLGPRS